MNLRTLAGGLLVLVTLSDTAVAAPDIAGYYRLPANNLLAWPRPAPMVVALYPCTADKFCGRIAALGGLPATDANNPEAGQRQRALCGLVIMELHEPEMAEPDTPWRGSYYDPATGDTAEIVLRLTADGNLRATRYAGHPFVSRAIGRPPQTWQRVTPVQATCERDRKAS